MEEKLKIRLTQINELKSCVTKIQEKVSMILQGFQWDLKQVLERPEMVTCAFIKNHRIPISSRDSHERRCLLALDGYSEQDKLFPEPAQSGIKLSNQQIQDVIMIAAKNDPLFKRGVPTNDILVPQSLERLQATYTPDERRAIYDAVVAAAPQKDDFTDLPLPASNNAPGSQVKSREQVLAELRDMKRRRAKYRGASRTANYSDALRDLISSQMELYTGVQNDNTIKKSATSVVIKQEPDLEKPTTETDSRKVDRYYDRALDRNLLYGRDRSRSRSRERRTFVDRRFDNRRLESQRKVFSRSPSKEIKQERSVSRQRFDDRHKESRRSPEKSFKDRFHSRRRSRERSNDRNERRREKEDTRSRDKYSSGSKYSTDSSRRDGSTRHRDDRSNYTDRHSDIKHEKARSAIKDREEDRYRKRDDRRSSKHTEPKRYYDV